MVSRPDVQITEINSPQPVGNFGCNMSDPNIVMVTEENVFDDVSCLICFKIDSNREPTSLKLDSRDKNIAESRPDVQITEINSPQPVGNFGSNIPDPNIVMVTEENVTDDVSCLICFRIDSNREATSLKQDSRDKNIADSSSKRKTSSTNFRDGTRDNQTNKQPQRKHKRHHPQAHGRLL